MNDGVKVATFKCCVSWTAWKQRVASKQQRSIRNRKRDGAFGVAWVVNGMQSQLAHFDHFGIIIIINFNIVKLKRLFLATK